MHLHEKLSIFTVSCNIQEIIEKYHFFHCNAVPFDEITGNLLILLKLLENITFSTVIPSRLHSFNGKSLVLLPKCQNTSNLNENISRTQPISP